MTRSKRQQEEEEQETSPLLFQDFDSDTVLLVYRKHPTKRTPEFLFRLSPDEATPDLIADIAGGGEFLIKERTRKQGRMTWGRFKSLDIAGQPKDPDLTRVPGNSGRQVEFIKPGGAVKTAEDFAAERKVAEAGAHQIGLQDVMTAGVLDLLKAGRETQAMQLEAMRAAMMEKNRIDWPALITALGTIVGPLLTVLLEGRKNQPDLNPISLVGDVAKIIRETAGPKSGLKEQLEMMMLLREFMDERGGGEGEGGIDGILSKGLRDVIGAAMQAKAAQQQSSTPPAGLLPPATGEHPPAAGGDAPMLAIVRALGPYRKQLISLAQQGKDPVISAEFLVEMLPEPAREQLIIWITEGGSLDAATKLLPELAETPIWAQEFWDAMVAALDLGEEPEEVEEEEPVTPAPKAKRSRTASNRQQSNPKQEEE